MKKNNTSHEQLSLFSDKPSIDKKSTTRKKFLEWKIFIDGASRGNPGASGAGIYGINHEGSVIIKEGLFLGIKTNNQAEYLALVFALYYVQNSLKKTALDHIKICFISDSQLLIQQMNGIYKVKNPVLQQMKTAIEALLIPLHCSFKHVLREYNTNADELANLGIDKKRKIPQTLTHFAALYNIPL